MKQRINLYHVSTTRVSFKADSLAGGLAIVVGVVGLFVLSSLVLLGYNGFQQSYLAELQERKKVLDQQVVTEQARFTSAKVHPEIKAETARVRQDISALQDLKALLQYVQPERQQRFSPYLYALADSSSTESWLVNFSIDNNQSRFALSGAATSAPAVPLMLETMAKTTAFKGINIADLNVRAEEVGVSFTAAAELLIHD